MPIFLIKYFRSLNIYYIHINKTKSHNDIPYETRQKKKNKKIKPKTV